MISLHYTSDRVIRFRCANTIIYIQGIPGSYGYRSLEIIYYIEDIQAPTDIPAKDHFYIYIYIYILIFFSRPIDLNRLLLNLLVMTSLQTLSDLNVIKNMFCSVLIVSLDSSLIL